MNANDRRNHDRPVTDQRLEAYLDGSMPPDELAEFERLLTTDAEAALEVELQRQIDARLRKSFRVPELSSAQIEQVLSDRDQPSVLSGLSSSRHTRRFLLVAVGGLAATIACILFAWQWSHRIDLEPYFRARPLVEIYREMVNQGFRPYYFCEDEDRFRFTFEKRQNVPLRLAEMPAERRMIGLSYSGGLSRNTTAMLCYVGQTPVVVFIDRREEDIPMAANNPDTNLRVFRKRIGDLVLYEVTPLETANIMDYLEIGPPRS